MTDVHTTAAAFWDREIAAPTHVSWMEPPAVRLYINQCVSGPAGGWPLDWLARELGGRRFRRALSIGCGTGPMERDLILRNLCDSIDAFDGSPHSIFVARREAASLGFGERIRYFVADFNRPLPLRRRNYDLVVFHQSLHHVAKLEKLLASVHRAMSRDALLYLDEFVGPSRHDWTDQRIAAHREIYGTIPSDWRIAPSLALPIQADDPSEAIRSSEIMPMVRKGFDVLHDRPYGGSLLSVVYGAIDWNRADPDLLPSLIEAEREMIRKGEPPYHAVVLARPKRGLAGLIARLRYFAEPKLRRIRWEIRRRLSDGDVPF
jgi:SAM-dependent methyltransferase